MPAPAPRARGRPRDATLPERRRAEILDAAAAVFSERGYSGTDLQVVADALRVGKGTIYRYFPTKQDLFFAAVDRGMERLRERIQAAAETAPDPLDRIARAMRAHLSYFEEEPEVAELLVQERAEFRDRGRSTYFVHHEANVGPWRTLYRDLVREGRVRAIPVDRIFDVVSGILYGAAVTSRFASRRRPFAANVEDTIDLLLVGLLSDRERARRGRSPGRRRLRAAR